MAGDVWPHDCAVVLPPTLSQFWVRSFATNPGSPECQQHIADCRQLCQGAFDRPDQQAFVVAQLCSFEHWVWLCLRRDQQSDSDSQPHRWYPVYRDSLSIRGGSERCRAYAVQAWQFLQEVFGQDRLAVTSLPPRQAESTQKDSTSCGFHCLAWTESQYRQWRGEGVFRVSQNWLNKAAELTKFFESVSKCKTKKPLPNRLCYD